jgi:competence protein ComEA
LVVTRGGDFQRRVSLEEFAPSLQFRGSIKPGASIMIKFIVTTLLSLCAAAAFAAEANKATQAELETIKGIGPAMSTKILDARKSGPFANWGDLQGRVKGVGQGNAAKFSADGLTVNGAAFTPDAQAPAKEGKAPRAARRAASAKQ